jgi:hypothetical protein
MSEYQWKLFMEVSFLCLHYLELLSFIWKAWSIVHRLDHEIPYRRVGDFGFQILDFQKSATLASPSFIILDKDTSGTVGEYVSL